MKNVSMTFWTDPGREIENAIRRLPQTAWLTRAVYWKPKSDRGTMWLLELLLSKDRQLWLFTLTGTKQDHNRDIFLKLLEKTGLSHAWTRAELLPLVAVVDPEVRTLGSKLMAATKMTK